MITRKKLETDLDKERIEFEDDEDTDWIKESFGF